MSGPIIIVGRGESVRVILCAEAHCVWRDARSDLPAGAELEIERGQAERLVRAGIARWPGRPAQPEHAA